MPTGTSQIRRQGTNDPLLKRMLRVLGLEEVPVTRRTERKAKLIDAWAVALKRWAMLASKRDGPVNPVRSPLSSGSLTALIRDKARSLGASDLGCALLTESMIAEGVEIDVPHIISLIVTENYAAVLNGALAVEAEALRSYERCAEIAHTLADFIRSLGYRAIADHNCIEDIQAIPALYACGMGELGKHGSLIHPRFGSGFRASFVVTDAPLVLDSPRKFGVEETCMRCNVCTRNCPPAAIPSSDEFIVTEGVKRWLTNIERCYLASRMREEYCHICVDVCPYVRSSPPDPVKSTIYSTYMAKRRKAGWNTPAWFIEDEQRVMTDGTTSD